MQQFYNKWWEEGAIDEGYDFKWKWPIIKRVMPYKGKVLDFGCGTGRYIEELLKLNPYKIVGIDISDSAIKIAKKRFPNPEFYAVGGDEKLPLKSANVDFVLAADVIEHIFDVTNFICEMKRVMKKGGRIFISTPYHGMIKNIVVSLIGFDKVFDPTAAHIRFFTKNNLSKLLTENGFRIIEYGQYGRFKPLSRGMYFLSEKL